MNENLQRKHQIVEEVRERFLASKIVILAEYRGVDVSGMTELRRSARELNVYVRIVKNTLAKRAVENTGYECLKDRFLGPLAIALSDDPVVVAKLMHEFSKSNDALKIQTGAMNGEILSPEELKVLATLPSRDELLARLVGTMSAPLQNLVGTLSQIPASMIRVLSAVRDSRSE